MTPGKSYLGDAVYVDVDNCGSLVLTTENGIRETNRIVLEPEVLSALERYVERCRAADDAEERARELLEEEL